MCAERTAGPELHSGSLRAKNTRGLACWHWPCTPCRLARSHPRQRSHNPSGKIKPASLEEHPAPSLALARSALSCLALGGGHARRAMPPAPGEANSAKAYTWLASAGTRCGREGQAGSAPGEAKPMVCRGVSKGCEREARVPSLAAAVVHRRWNLEASKQRVVSQAAHRLPSPGPQRLVVLCKRPSNNAIERTVQQRRFACCCPAAHCEHSASCGSSSSNTRAGYASVGA